jgi:hypothetical protein
VVHSGEYSEGQAPFRVLIVAVPDYRSSGDNLVLEVEVHRLAGLISVHHGGCSNKRLCCVHCFALFIGAAVTGTSPSTSPNSKSLSQTLPMPLSITPIEIKVASCGTSRTASHLFQSVVPVIARFSILPNMRGTKSFVLSTRVQDQPTASHFLPSLRP